MSIDFTKFTRFFKFARFAKFKELAKGKKLSPIWIFPILTVLIGIWAIYSHFSHQGKSFTLVTSDASSIVAGKTIIKSRNVEVGLVDKVLLSKDLKQVKIRGRMARNMENILKKDSIFWVVKPQIDIEGVSGLGTLLSGIYIAVMPGKGPEADSNPVYKLLDSPPIAALNMAGRRVNLVGKNTGVVSAGAPVLFRGFRVGNVEKAEFDVKDKVMNYQLFIAKPYDTLITKNIRFWHERGINLDLSPRGANLEVPSLDVLLAGGISFDVPSGTLFGHTEKNVNVSRLVYELYPDKESIQDSKYTEYDEFLVLFSESIAGLTVGAPVEYRGIRIGTVTTVPYFFSDVDLISKNEFTIAVLIKIEPQRLAQISKKLNISQLIVKEQDKGLRASLKSSNLLTGSMYVDLDFVPNYINDKSGPPSTIQGFKTIATVPSGLSQLQKKVFNTLDNFNKLPLQQTVTELNKTIESLNKIVGSKSAQSLPKELQQSLISLKKTLQSVQPGTKINQSLQSDLEKFARILDQVSPLLKTLNQKSNALIFAAPAKSDPKPKAKGNEQ